MNDTDEKVWKLQFIRFIQWSMASKIHSIFLLDMFTGTQNKVKYELRRRGPDLRHALRPTEHQRTWHLESTVQNAISRICPHFNFPRTSHMNQTSRNNRLAVCPSAFRLFRSVGGPCNAKCWSFNAGDQINMFFCVLLKAIRTHSLDLLSISTAARS